MEREIVKREIVIAKNAREAIKMASVRSIVVMPDYPVNKNNNWKACRASSLEDYPGLLNNLKDGIGIIIQPHPDKTKIFAKLDNDICSLNPQLPAFKAIEEHVVF